jgi:nucleoside-diphosphate-sugar epimerase
MRKGKKVIVHGDGTSLWTLTHSSDFARGLVGVLGKNRAIGEAFQITSDELLTWNQIFQIVAKVAGASADIIHIPSDVINKFDPEWGAGLLGDKSHSMIFDNSKIKRIVPDFAATIPFARGAEEIIAWHDADPARKIIDENLSQLMDEMITRWESLWR